VTGQALENSRHHRLVQALTGEEPELSRALARLGELSLKERVEVSLAAYPGMSGTTLARVGPLLAMAAAPLRRALREAREPAIRCAAADLLGWCRVPEAAPPLVEALADRGDGVSLAAARALVRLGEAVLPVVLPSLYRSEPGVAGRAGEVLASLGEVVVEPLLAELPRLPAVGQQVAAQVLGEIGDKRAVPGLSSLLDSNLVPVRVAAVRALALLGGDAVLAYLGLSLGDPSREVRAAAAQGLGRLGGRQAVEWLQSALADAEACVQVSAEEALTRLVSRREN